MTVHASSPEDAQAIANAFAEETVEDRTEQLHEAIDRITPQLEAQADSAATDTATGAPVDAVLAELEALQRGPGPLPAGRDARAGAGGASRAEARAVDGRRDRRRARARDRRSPSRSRCSIRAFGARSSCAASTAFRSLRGSRASRAARRQPADAAPPLARRLRGLPHAARDARDDLRLQPRAGGRRSSSPARRPPRARRRPASTSPPRSRPQASSVILIEADLRRPSICPRPGPQPPTGCGRRARRERAAVRGARHQPHVRGPNLGFLLADYEGGWIVRALLASRGPRADRRSASARRLRDRRLPAAHRCRRRAPARAATWTTC